ncbi:TPA_asm: hypothetical protein [ssRNA phage Gerhypos.2_29]|jgi:hypothetical protein|uniref:Uncharacterized protein n=2 Tax=Leviviricetes TaxID=2842243 RepID=A0A8S5L200_9VIRU|nr:hypothetical protein QIP43_gp3 [ssRNA phage Gerhypos.2_29]QDH90258.1 MAG: hypothetical protein H2Bulk35834_000002 [Leviviridae sp.]DAD51476.1 TPA_asm: hypothetical protein [ssRNA phage Gerhypos.2_29]
MGLHSYELASPCQRIVLAMEDLPSQIGTSYRIQVVLQEDLVLMKDIALIVIRVIPSLENI